jgi:hypothetical protein
MNKQQGLVKTLGLIIAGVALLAYFHVDVQKTIESPQVKPRISASISFIQTGLSTFMNILNQRTEEKTAATSTP